MLDREGNLKLLVNDLDNFCSSGKMKGLNSNKRGAATLKDKIKLKEVFEELMT